MENNPIHDISLHENRFWLQIMGDHSRFIFFSLAPTESEYLFTAQEFIILFDELLDQAQKQLPAAEVIELNESAFDAISRLREFKIELLKMSLTSDLKSHLSSSFYNDMLNELEEYMYILSALMHGKDPVFHPLHYHMLWLMDAIGHAATLSSTLDLVEKDLIDRSYRFEVHFNDLYLKSLMMSGYLRTQLDNFPSLDRFNEDVRNTITDFTEFLEKLRDQRMDNKVLGSLMPLMADHMAREECYYLLKLSQNTDNIRKPDCDSSRPRVEA